MAKWFILKKKADFETIGKKFGIHPVTARLLRNRNLTEEEMIERYLNGGVESMYSPHLLKDADKLVDILLTKIKENKNIRIIGDYDIDGVMSTYILHQGIKRAGGIVDYAIPHRIMDGYGLNGHLIELAKEDGVDTIITCDNGISAIKEIAFAKENNMTVLVTDHHQIPFEEVNGEIFYLRSEADAIVNPHQPDCTYPYKELCGAGVAYKVVQLLYEACGIAQDEWLELLPFAAFATVGDIMPLTDENRILVKEGLKRMRSISNLGMKALIMQCGLEPEKIDAYHIGFVLGPCVNAAGRLETARLAMELLLAENPGLVAQKTAQLVELNEERKDKTKEGVELAKQIASDASYEKDKVLVLFLEGVHESIAGIIAGKVRECFERPTIILTRAEEGVKGSGRSIEGYSMYEELCKCRDLLTRFGGHPMAAGLSLEEENIQALRERLNRNCLLSEDELQEKLMIDIDMPIDFATIDMVEEWELLKPFGRENPKPIFADKDILIQHMFLVGKKQNVLRMNLISKNGKRVQAVYFRDVERFVEFMREKFGAEEVQKALDGKENEIRLTLAYAPNINTYQGRTNLQIEVLFYC